MNLRYEKFGNQYPTLGILMWKFWLVLKAV